MENLKTLGQLLQIVVEADDDKWYSLNDFLLQSTDEDRKRIEEKLVDADQIQFYEYMDWFNFVNSTEVYCAVSEYYEFVMNRPVSMGEMWDMSEIADYYMSERWLEFDEE